MNRQPRGRDVTPARAASPPHRGPRPAPAAPPWPARAAPAPNSVSPSAATETPMPTADFVQLLVEDDDAQRDARAAGRRPSTRRRLPDSAPVCSAACWSQMAAALTDDHARRRASRGPLRGRPRRSARRVVFVSAPAAEAEEDARRPFPGARRRSAGLRPRASDERGPPAIADAGAADRQPAPSRGVVGARVGLADDQRAARGRPRRSVRPPTRRCGCGGFVTHARDRERRTRSWPRAAAAR